MRNLVPDDETLLRTTQDFLVRTRTGHQWHLPAGAEQRGRSRTKCGLKWVEFWTWDYADREDHLCNRCLSYLGVEPVTP